MVAQRVVEVVDPDPGWPEGFARERARIEAALRLASLADEIVAIEHIGSTAVPGLPAKPIIDVLIGLRRWPTRPEVLAVLEGLGYVHRGEAGIVGRHYLQDGPPGASRTRQLHAVEHGGRIWRDQLRFRDHLRTHADERDAYAALKRDLARAHRHAILGYMEGKRPFIRDALARARAADGEPSVRAVAQRGFGSDPARYERARPGYPAAAVSWLAARAGLRAGARVADLGAGTGKLTSALLATGAEVVAIEPVAAMREYLAAALPDAQVVDGTAEDLPLPMACLDVVAAGQAFHWFDPTAALSEAHRVLRPGGAVALAWNEQDESVPWVGAWNRLSERARGPAPDRRTSPWAEVVATTELFTSPVSATFDNPHLVDRATLVDRVASTSFVAALDDTAREAHLGEFTALLDHDPGTRERDEIVVPYRTTVHLLRRIP